MEEIKKQLKTPLNKTTAEDILGGGFAFVRLLDRKKAREMRWGREIGGKTLAFSYSTE